MAKWIKASGEVQPRHVRRIRVTVEPSRVRKRVWLKAVDEDGYAEVITNIPRSEATRYRNKLVEKLTDSGLYEEVTGEAIRLPPDVVPRNPWTIDKTKKEK